jgi:hypothetical protein
MKLQATVCPQRTATTVIVAKLQPLLYGGWQNEKLVLKGQWCRNHDKWWKRIELPEIPKDVRKGVRNHLFTFLSLAGIVTLAIKGFPVFPITLAAATLGVILYLIYTLLWDFFDHL